MTAAGPPRPQRLGWQIALAAWIGLIVLSLLWELWLAPLRPGGLWWLVKTVPLLVALPGLLRAHAYTMQWALMLSLAYLLEGVVRVFDPMPAAALAAIEIVLALAFFVGSVLYLRPLKLAARRESALPR
jgi:uncharacterized membrane protein